MLGHLLSSSPLTGLALAAWVIYWTRAEWQAALLFIAFLALFAVVDALA